MMKRWKESECIDDIVVAAVVVEMIWWLVTAYECNDDKVGDYGKYTMYCCVYEWFLTKDHAAR